MAKYRFLLVVEDIRTSWSFPLSFLPRDVDPYDFADAVCAQAEEIGAECNCVFEPGTDDEPLFTYRVYSLEQTYLLPALARFQDVFVGEGCHVGELYATLPKASAVPPEVTETESPA